MKIDIHPEKKYGITATTEDVLTPHLNPAADALAWSSS
jgi:hypothetical protein